MAGRKVVVACKGAITAGVGSGLGRESICKQKLAASAGEFSENDAGADGLEHLPVQLTSGLRSGEGHGMLRGRRSWKTCQLVLPGTHQLFLPGTQRLAKRALGQRGEAHFMPGLDPRLWLGT